MIEHKIAFDDEDDEEQTGVTRSDGSRIKRRPPEGTKDALRQSFETTAKRRRPVAIFIDEAQHLGKVSGTQLQNQLDCIKSLADDTGTIIVLIGTYELLPLRNLSAQLIGRSLDIHFPRYRNTKKELSQFKNVLRTFQDALPFAEETNVLLNHWEFCYEQSIGCVGNLRLMLVRAVHAALWSNEKNLSWKSVQTHAFSEIETYKMMHEAYEGERNLASNSEQRTKLREMLGIYSQSKPEEEKKLNTPQEETSPEGKASQDDQPDETKNDVKQDLSTGEVTVGISVNGKVFQSDQPHESKNDIKQELPNEEATVEASIVENLVLDARFAETMNKVEPTVSTEEISTNETSLNPLKKPKTAAPRPFRRKSKRDRTGGPPQKNEEKD